MHNIWLMEHEANESRYETLIVDDIKYRTLFNTKYNKRKSYKPTDPKKVTAFLPGTIQKIMVKKGSRVKEGDRLLILEAMKMRNDIIAPLNGVIKGIFVSEGEKVTKDHLMVEFE